MGKGFTCNGCRSTSVKYSGVFCSKCTSKLFFNGRKKGQLTNIEIDEFKCYQFGKANMLKEEHNRKRQSDIGKSITIKVRSGTPLNSSEQVKFNSRERQKRQDDISKSVTIKVRSGTPLNSSEQVVFNSRKRQGDISKSVTIKGQSGTPLNSSEQVVFNSRKRQCDISKSVTIKANNGSTLSPREQGSADRRKRGSDIGKSATTKVRSGTPLNSSEQAKLDRRKRQSDNNWENALQESRDRVAVVGGLYEEKALKEVGSTLTSILIKGMCTTDVKFSSLYFERCLPTSSKQLQYMIVDNQMPEYQQADIDRGIIKNVNIIPLYLMKLYMLYIFFGYYNQNNLEKDRKKYRENIKFRNMWFRISCHYNDAGLDTTNHFLSMGNLELNELIDLLECTFGKDQIQAFGRNFDNDHDFKSISEVLLRASVYFGESRRPLHLEDLRWIIAYGYYQDLQYFPNLMRPAGFNNRLDRHRVERAELRDPNHLALMSQVIGPPFLTRSHSRFFEGLLHHFMVPWYMGVLNLQIHQVRHRLTLWKEPSRGAFFHRNDAAHSAAGGTYYCFMTYSYAIPHMIDNGDLEFNDRDTVPNITVQ